LLTQLLAFHALLETFVVPILSSGKESEKFMEEY